MGKKAKYRTPSSFQSKAQAKQTKKAHSKDAKNAQAKQVTRSQNLAKRMEHPRPKS